MSPKRGDRVAPPPAPGEWDRQHPLRGSYATGTHSGREQPQWQIEVTSGGRIWYLVDVDAHKIFVMYASTQHPKATD